MKINLMPNDDISKYSAIPPQTPDIDRSVEDFLSFFYIRISSLYFSTKTLNANFKKIRSHSISTSFSLFSLLLVYFFNGIHNSTQPFVSYRGLP